MLKLFRQFCIFTFLVTGSVFASAGVIVDLSADGTSNISNPITINFQPGDIFVLTPLGTGDGGAFDAYSFWDANLGCDPNGANCVNGFQWYLAAYINGDTSIPGGFGFFGSYFATGALALSNVRDALVASFGQPFFTIDTEAAGLTSLSLYVTDIDYSDNRGGLSFMYDVQSSVPLPGTFALICLGLLGVVGRGRAGS